MRARVAAQGFTILCIAYYSLRPSQQRTKEAQERLGVKKVIEEAGKKQADTVTIQ